MRFAKYSGTNQSWPVSPGSMAEASYAIPVYRGYPERPYEVIGSVRFEDPRKYWDDGIISMAADTGKHNGGDALVITRFGTPGSWLDSFTSSPTGYDNETKTWVIKWIPEIVLQAREAELSRFWAGFKQKHPALATDQHLVQAAVDFLTSTGNKPNSPELEEKLVNVLTALQNQSRDNLSGKWLFKATIQSRTLTSSKAESYSGLVAVAASGSKITMISTEGNVEINFSGTSEGGQLSGLLGFGGKIASVSVKCDGVAMNEKVSLTFQKPTDEGTVQGTLTLQR